MQRDRVRRILRSSLSGAGAIIFWLLARDWFWLIPHSVFVTTRGVFLHALLVVDVALWFVAPCVFLIAAARIATVGGRVRKRPIAARAALVSLSVLFALASAEGGAAAWSAWTHRMPTLQPRTPPRVPSVVRTPVTLRTDFDRNAKPADPNSPADSHAPAAQTKEIVVIGESSARGEPYHPWLSIAQIAAWKLDDVIPHTRFHVNMLATGGVTLEQTHQALETITTRPDAIFLYGGHNEFHSRYAYYRVVKPPEAAPAAAPARPAWSGPWDAPLGKLIREAIARNGVEVAPMHAEIRHLADWPVCTPEEYDTLVDDFERRLEAIVVYCEQLGALPILVLPAGNDLGYEPNRSVPARPLSLDELTALEHEYRAMTLRKKIEPDAAIKFYRAQIRLRPEFAEPHYQLALLCEQKGDIDAARREAILARDLDGFPQRCPSRFQSTFRRIAARHPSVLLLDAPAILAAISPRGLLDRNVFHDGQHPTLAGYTALAQALLGALRDRRAWGWPDAAPTPRLDVAEVARHFGLDRDRWIRICERSAYFYERTAFLRYDPRPRQAVIKQYYDAKRDLQAGKSPDDLGIPGVGTHPAGVKPPSTVLDLKPKPWIAGADLPIPASADRPPASSHH